jgi:uncharacterized delta-60 repeat protein
MRKPHFGVRGLISGAVGCFLLASSTPVSATSGVLDPSFGTGGRVTTDLGGGFADAYALAQQPDGKIVAVGHTTVAVGDDFALVRYRTDGSLDPGFGTGGVVTTDFFGVFDHANAVALQRDGRIVAAGSAFSGSLPGHDDFALARYRTDGSLDPSFGTGGKVTTSIGEFNRAWAVAVQHDGRIVAAGYASGRFALVRYRTDGSLDPSFGTAGVVTTDVPGGAEEIFGLTIQRDGRIVVAGYASGAFALARYDRNGALDPSFGTGGIVTTDFGGFAYASAVTLQPTGRIVAAGRATVPGNPPSDIALARYRSDGALDATFGTGGRVTTDFGGDDQAYAVGLQRHGRIVVAGTSLTGPTNNDFALARYRSDGSLDPAFAAGGRATTDFAGSFDQARAVLVQRDGRIVAAGRAVVGAVDNFALARYLAAGHT